jgi:hypothetical protein
VRPGSTIRTACAAILRALVAAAVLLAACLIPAGAAAQSELADAESGGAMPMVRTESPRQTLATFMRLRDALEAALAGYYEDGSIASSERLDLAADQMRGLFDLRGSGRRAPRGRHRDRDLCPRHSRPHRAAEP